MLFPPLQKRTPTGGQRLIFIQVFPLSFHPLPENDPGKDDTDFIQQNQRYSHHQLQDKVRRRQNRAHDDKYEISILPDFDEKLGVHYAETRQKHQNKGDFKKHGERYSDPEKKLKVPFHCINFREHAVIQIEKKRHDKFDEYKIPEYQPGNKQNKDKGYVHE